MINQINFINKILNLRFQDAYSPYIYIILYFYDLVILFIIIIVFISFFFIIYLVFSKFLRDLLEDDYLELTWTLIPILVLIIVTIPSLFLLYLIDNKVYSCLTIKIIGNQWFWRYEYGDLEEKNTDSYIIKEENIIRLLDVDNRVVIPINIIVRLLVRSTDVLHSFAVPSLGIKIDAVPGRLNQGFIFLEKPGIFFGQCSEICGTNHRFMPIIIESVNMEDYIKWLQTM